MKEISGNLNQVYEYVGREGYYREEFDLYLLGVRWYDSEVGRFISRNSPYTFKKNNPINSIHAMGTAYKMSGDEDIILGHSVLSDNIILTLIPILWPIYKGVSTGASIGNAILALYAYIQCSKCLEKAKEYICEAKKRLDILEFEEWKKSSQPGTECSEICKEASERLIETGVWIGIRIAPYIVRPILSW